MRATERRGGSTKRGAGACRRGARRRAAASVPARERARARRHAPLEIQQFPGGYSNLTYLVRSGRPRVGPAPSAAGAAVRGGHDMLREYRLLSRAGARSTPKAPRPLAACEDVAVLGAPFYLMERVRGVILRAAAAGRRDAGSTCARSRRRCVDTLAELHAVDVGAAGLADLGKPEGYVARQVRGWTERCAGVQTDECPRVDAPPRWLAAQSLARARPGARAQRLQVRQPRARPRRPRAHRGRARLGDGDGRRSAARPGHVARVLGGRRTTRPSWRRGALVDLTARPGIAHARRGGGALGAARWGATSTRSSPPTCSGCSRSRSSRSRSTPASSGG